MPTQTLRGVYVFWIGMFLVVAAGLYGASSRLVAEHNFHHVLFTASLIVVIGANCLSFGILRMITHIYAKVSQMDPRSDRPLRGTLLYLAGQITSTTFFVCGMLLRLPVVLRAVHNTIFTACDIFIYFAAAFFALGWAAGLFWMLWDFFDRVRELRRLPRFDPRIALRESLEDSDRGGTPIVAPIDPPTQGIRKH